MAITNSYYSEQQMDSRRQLSSLLHRNRDIAHRAAAHRDARTRRQAAKTGLELRHPDFANAIAGKITGNYIIALSAIAVVFIDILLFGALADFLVRLGFGGNPAFILAAKIILPIMVVWLELKLATLLAMEQEKHIEGMGRTRQYWFYLSFGIMIVCIMPAISLATTLAIRSGTPAGARLAFDAMAIGLAVLALAAHGLVLFGGQGANRAMAHVVFNVKHRNLNRSIQRSDIRYRREANQLIVATTSYINAFTDHNMRYPDARIEPGPFDRVTRETVNEVFGYEVVQAPAGTRGTRGTVTNGTVVNPPTPPQAQDATEQVHTKGPDQEGQPDNNESVFSREAEDEVRV